MGTTATEPLTPEQRSMRAKLAADTRWGRTPAPERKAQTDRTREAFYRRFLDEVDRENPGLPESERRRLANSKLSAHMTRLALKSSRARSRTPGAGEARVA